MAGRGSTEPGSQASGSLPDPQYRCWHPAPAPIVMISLLVGWNRATGADRYPVGASVRSPASTIPVAWTVVAICAAAASTSALELAATVRATGPEAATLIRGTAWMRNYGGNAPIASQSRGTPRGGSRESWSWSRQLSRWWPDVALRSRRNLTVRRHRRHRRHDRHRRHRRHRRHPRRWCWSARRLGPRSSSTAAALARCFRASARSAGVAATPGC